MQEAVALTSPVVPKPQHLLDEAGGVKGVARRLRDATEVGDEGKLNRAIADFEAFFIYYMLKAMRETVHKTGLLGGSMEEELYTGLWDQEIATDISAQGGIGVGRLLRDQLLPASSVLEPVTPIHHLPAGHTALLGERSAEGFGEFSVPVDGRTSSPYGPRSDPMTGSLRFHAGIDIAAPVGTVVRAAEDGRVTFSGRQPGYGNVVIVEHASGYSTIYAHHRENLVERGELVSRDQPIGRVGETGRTTGPHLHFEVRKEGFPIDPYLVIVS